MPELISVTGPEGGVVTITLDRPEKKNALSIALRDEVTRALRLFEENQHVKVVVFTGAGDVFSAGFDLDEFKRIEEPAFAERLWSSSDHFHRAVLQFPLPTVAAVNGPAIAGGFDLAVMCDLRVAADTAWFAHPEVSFSEVVYSPLQELVGAAIARDLTFTGRRIDAHEAKTLNLVREVVPPDELDDAVRRVTDQLTHAPREVLLRMKGKAIRRSGISTGPTLEL